jgi:hypothetical protein
MGGNTGRAGAQHTAGQTSIAGAGGGTQGTTGCSLMPDSAKYLRFKSSGGLPLQLELTGASVHQGADAGCNGAWSDGSFSVGFFIPVPIAEPDDNPTGILSLIAELPLGKVVSGSPVRISILTTGHIWNSADVCTLEIIDSQQLGSESAYALTGSVKCSAPVPDVASAQPVSVQQFEFAAALAVNP